jgi:hypothetical protein
MLVLITRPAYAYIDPGAGSLLLQGIIGGIAALLVVTKMYWRRIVALFRGNQGTVSSQPPARGPDQ